ncbi:MAG: ribonuclease P protein component [Candidatus Harrisonbacteria bacterium CG10_big_fil_rev_8_21_14_0_10_38_8]|uniref:Ribonuclease P protein component n=1 Tax=Candidatus Harrisonbacteria bacterium CG10_big_fil_rev_8_21_14_0_10_38_8 TaxID=1974582 RepID=A0A2M6WKD5_9BACT|nr:MAG: ribonuclease P protein component [Candidatus Harrisonbacteria bacterium CG10_big_fil_rev_8_21_14_0_10_38_8]
MIAKKYRLPVQDFIGKNGSVKKTRYFLFKSFSKELPYPRIGVVIGKKVFKSAAKRNVLKRKIYNYFREKELLKKTNKDILVIGLKDLCLLKDNHAIIDALEKNYENII